MAAGLTLSGVQCHNKEAEVHQEVRSAKDSTVTFVASTHPAPPATPPPSRAESQDTGSHPRRVEEGLEEMDPAPSPHPQHPVVHPWNYAFLIPLEN